MTTEELVDQLSEQLANVTETVMLDHLLELVEQVNRKRDELNRESGVVATISLKTFSSWGTKGK